MPDDSRKFRVLQNPIFSATAKPVQILYGVFFYSLRFSPSQSSPFIDWAIMRFSLVNLNCPELGKSFAGIKSPSQSNVSLSEHPRICAFPTFVSSAMLSNTLRRTLAQRAVFSGLVCRRLAAPVGCRAFSRFASARQEAAATTVTSPSERATNCKDP